MRYSGELFKNTYASAVSPDFNLTGLGWGPCMAFLKSPLGESELFRPEFLSALDNVFTPLHQPL